MPGKPANVGAVLCRIEAYEISDLLKPEAGSLSRTDELQPPDVRVTIAPYATAGAATRWAFRRFQQAAPLIVAHRLYAHPSSLREPRNRHRLHSLTPDYGTDPT